MESVTIAPSAGPPARRRQPSPARVEGTKPYRKREFVEDRGVDSTLHSGRPLQSGGGGSSPRTSAQRRDLSVLVPRRVVPVSDDCGRCAKGTKTQEV